MNRALAGAVLAFLLARTADPQAAVANLSTKEQAERIAMLPEDDRRWLDFVEPILLASERNFFLLLTEPHQREIFREEFWKRRENPNLPPPLGVGYRHRYEVLLRLADETYDGRREDAGLMVIAHGEPISVDGLEACHDMFRNLEIWTYAGEPGTSSARHYFFYRRAPQTPRRLWTRADSTGDVFQPGSCRRNFDDLARECQRKDVTDPCPLVNNCEAACRVYQIYQEIRFRQGSAVGGTTDRAQTLAQPAVATEDLADLAARFPGIADPSAKPIAVESEKTRSSAPVQVATTPSRTLTYEEIRERIIQLPPKYRQWLDLAAPLLTTGDLVRFLLFSDSERDRFIREFFKRRRGPGV